MGLLSVASLIEYDPAEVMSVSKERGLEKERLIVR